MVTQLPKPIQFNLPQPKNGWYGTDKEYIEQFWRDGKKMEDRFRCRITIRENGKRKQRTVQAESKKAAQDALLDLQGKAKQGGVKQIDAARVTFRQLASAFTTAKLNPPVYNASDGDGLLLVKDDSGRHNYKEAQRRTQLWEAYFGDRLISSITHSELIEWRDTRKRQPVEKRRNGDATVRSWRDVHVSLQVLRQCLNYAVDKGWLVRNPASDKGRGKLNKLIRSGLESPRTRALDAEEEARLLDAVSNPFLKSVLRFLVGTGIRVEEAEKIERGMIDLDHGTYGHIYLPARITKTKKARDLPVLTKQLRDVIAERFAAIPESPDARVFGSIKDRCKRQFAAAKRTAKIKNFVMRDCRATFCTNALDVIPLPTVTKWMGHENPKMTMRYFRPQAASHKQHVATFEMHMIGRQTIQESVAVN
jgi:integrase